MEKKIVSLSVLGILLLVVSSFSIAQTEDLSLKVVAGSKDSVSVELHNAAPVRAVQFDLTGVKITQVRTTDRTRGFMSKFNEQNGKIILLSTSGETIAPGKGAVLQIACDKPNAAVLSGVRIVEE